MAFFGRLRVAFRGAMAFSFHCFMGSGMPLTARDTTALFSAYCSYCKSYAMVVWRHPRRECTMGTGLPGVFLSIFEGGEGVCRKKPWCLLPAYQRCKR